MTPMSVETDSTEAARLKQYQARAFALTWFSYAGYYLTRKPVSVVKKRLMEELGISSFWLGIMDTAYLAAYALGQFLCGMIGDRAGARKLLGYGMLGTAACSAAFGFSGVAFLFVLFWFLNGLLQSSGWPGNVKAMTPWFSPKSRGMVMGLWGTCYQVGGVVGTALAAWLLVNLGWRSAFFVPAALVALVGGAILLWLVEHPSQVGLRLPDASGSAPTRALEAGQAPVMPVVEAPMSMLEALRLPGILNLGAAYFGLKLIRYTLLFWLPFYLSKELGYAEDTAGYLSTAFEVGGIVGAIGVGYLSDKYFAQRRMVLAAPLIFCIGLALLLYMAVGSLGMAANAAAMALTGFLLFGPDALISGAAAQDLGGTRAAASAAGVINGLGSIGAILQGVVTTTVSEAYGWNGLFYVLVGLAVLSSLSLAPLVIQQLRLKS